MFHWFKNVRRLWPVSIAICALVLIAVWVRSTPPGDSRRASSGARDAHDLPRDGYVGMAACAQCHPGEHVTFLRSGHARTFQHTKDSSIARSLAGQQFHDPQRGVTYHYHFDAQGLSVTLPEKFGDVPFPLEYALGSGEHALTFLSLIPNRGGETVGIEHRVSYFGSSRQLGLTPSHRKLPIEQDVEHFGRVYKDGKLTGCVDCHTTTAEIHNQEIVNLRANVGCESCHGPGGRHVTAMERNQPDTAIQFGAHSWTAAEQLQSCGQCHRLPEMISSGITRGNARLARFQPVGLMQSACYLKSAGKLSCTTCHDPHKHASRDPTDYVTVCLTCHNPKLPDTAVCRVSPKTDCIQCHMPGLEIHPGIVFHDHWIRIRKDDDPQAAAEPPPEEE